MKSPVNIGVSIENGQITAVLLKETLLGQKLIDYDRRPIPGQAQPAEQVDIGNELIKGLVERNKVRNATLSLALPEDMIVFRLIELPGAVKENLKGALYYELNKHLPVLAEEVYFDCQLISEDREKAIIHVLLVVIKKKLLEPFLQLGADFSAGLARIAVTSTAAGSFLLHAGLAKKGKPLFFIKSAENQMSCTVFKAGRIQYMSKVNPGPEAGRANEAVNKQMQQTIDEVRAAFGSMDTVADPDDGLPDEMIKLLADAGMDLVSIDAGRVDLPEKQYMTAFGAALDPFAAGVNHLNLLPESLQKKPGRLGYYMSFFLAGVLAISAVMYAGTLVYQKKQAIDELDTKIASLQQQISEAGPIQGQYDQITARLQYLNDFGGNCKVIEMMRELSAILPQDSWLTEFRLNGNEIRMDGFSDSAAKLIGLLENSPLFDNARFLSTIRKSRDNKERFQIGMEVEPNG